jgi:hypothetical protein
MAQSCTVSVAALNGTYSGDCKNGKADGTGTATGTDSYTGSFKNGYPDGEGKYTWKNGNTYDGFWKKGLFEGKGTLKKTDDTKTDSLIIITGFFKKGKYIGQYENPYVVTALTNNINDLNTRKLNNARSEITITLKSITAGGATLSNPVMPKPKLINIQEITGRFDQQVNDESSSMVSNRYTLRGVKFPYHAIFSFETSDATKTLHTEKIEVEILESSNWFIQVGIDN